MSKKPDMTKPVTLAILPHLLNRLTEIVKQMLIDALRPFTVRLLKLEQTMVRREDVEQMIETRMQAFIEEMKSYIEQFDGNPPVDAPAEPTITTEEQLLAERNAAIDAAAVEVGYMPTLQERDYILAKYRNFDHENMVRALRNQAANNKASQAIVDACHALNIGAPGARTLARLIIDGKAEAHEIAKDISDGLATDAIMAKYSQPKVGSPEANLAEAKQKAADIATQAGYTLEVGGAVYWEQIHQAAEILLPYVGISTPDAQTAVDEVHRRFEGLVKNIQILKEED